MSTLRAFATSATFLFIIGGTACDRDEAPPPFSGGPVLKATTASVASVVRDPDWYRGKTIRVGGDVEQVHNPRAFTLEGDSLWWEKDIMVITVAPVAFIGVPLEESDDVIVTGHIAVGIADIEREVGRTLEPEVADAIADRAVLIARSIQLIDNYATWSSDDAKPSSIGLLALLTDSNTGNLEGERVHLDAVKVRSTGKRAIWVGPRRSKQVLVVPVDPTSVDGLRPGATVSITGTAKRMPPTDEAMRVFDLDAVAKREVGEATLYVEATRIDTLFLPTAMRDRPAR